MGIDAYDELLRKKLATGGVLLEPTRGTLNLVAGEGMAIELVDNVATKSTDVTFSQSVAATVGVSWKNAVTVVKDDNIDGTVEVGGEGPEFTGTALAVLGAVDGISPEVGDSVLLIGQTDQTQNGIWEILELGEAAVSAPKFRRRIDARISAQVTSQMRVPVANGTKYAGAVFRLTTPDDIALDSSDLVFSSDIIAVAGQLGWESGQTYEGEAVTDDGDPEANLLSITIASPGAYAVVAVFSAYESATGKRAVIGLRQNIHKTGLAAPAKLNEASDPPAPTFISGTGAAAADVADLVQSVEIDVFDSAVIFPVESVSAGSGPTVRWKVVVQILRLG